MGRLMNEHMPSTDRLLSDKEMQDIAAFLQGSTRNIEEAITSIGIIPMEQLLDEVCMRLDNFDIQQCTTCNWWGDIGELDGSSGEHTCEDCR